MNLDHQKLARTGRTTRMLIHAVARAEKGLYSMLLAHNLDHMKGLRQGLDTLLPQDKKERERLASFISHGSLGMMTRNQTNGHSNFYDYGTHNFQHQAPDQIEVLIDHFALERQLVHVIAYLRTSCALTSPRGWMIDSAIMLAAQGRRVYLVSDAPLFLESAKQRCSGHNVSVETPEELSNLNLLTQQLVGANPNCVVLIDPTMLAERFAGALNEINRWDLPN